MGSDDNPLTRVAVVPDRLGSRGATTVTDFEALVAHIHGRSCAPPEKTGPPIAWFVMTIDIVFPGVCTVNTFSPSLRPVTKPITRPLGRSANTPSGSGTE